MRILVAGDSLALPRPHKMNEYNFNEYNLAVAYENTYSSILNKELLKEFMFSPFVEVINKSRRSQTIQNIANEFIDLLFFHQPDVIVLQVGIVDCWFRDELGGKQYVPLDKYGEYLKNIMMYLNLRPECKLIIIGICPTSIKMDLRYHGLNREISKYNLLLKSVVDNKRTFYIDMEEYININNIHEYLHLDDHHLNKNGNSLIAEKILKIVRNLIFMEKGMEIKDTNNFKLMCQYFYEAYKQYSKNLDTIYNLLICLYETKQYEEIIKIIEFINNENIDDNEINNLISVIINQLSQ